MTRAFRKAMPEKQHEGQNFTVEATNTRHSGNSVNINFKEEQCKTRHKKKLLHGK